MDQKSMTSKTRKPKPLWREAKKSKLVVASVACSSSDFHATNTDWKLCCLCQTKTSRDPLVCPAENPVKSQINKGYCTLSDALDQLRLYRYKLPSGHELDSLDEGEGFEGTFIARKARWHKKCLRPYLSKKLDDLKESLIANTLCDEDASESLDNQEPECSKDRRSTRSSVPMVNPKEYKCFLCHEGPTKNMELHNCETKEITENVQRCATILGDSCLQGFLSEGDLVALEAKYHKKCLMRLYNKCRMVKCGNENELEEIMCEAIAFADLVVFIRSKLDLSSNYVFKMGDLRRIFKGRLAKLEGVSEDSVPNKKTTSLRMKILANFPSLQAHKSKREWILMQNDANILNNLDSEDQDEDAIAFHRFVKNMRKSIASTNVGFDGEFKKGCEEKCIPSSLLAFVNMILYGSVVRTECRATKPALTICQLILLNYRTAMPTGEQVRNKKDKEPPLAMYMALNNYGCGRRKDEIDEQHRHGISVSSTRVMEVTSQLTRLMIRRAEEEGALIPANLKKNVFTTWAIDNIDFRGESTTKKMDFHGSACSGHQAILSTDKPTEREFKTRFEDVAQDGMRSVPPLPSAFADVPECVLPTETPRVPGSTPETLHRMTPTGKVCEEFKREMAWLTHVHDSIADGEQLNDVSWSAYHASREKECHFLPAVSAMLPIFEEKSTSVSMVKHFMNLVLDMTEYLNVNQTSVLAADQPIFTVVKKVQWTWPHVYGEGKLVAMFGPLHIEQVFLHVIGEFMDGCGWESVVAHAGISTEGSAQGMLKVSHITRSRLYHQVTAAALFSLLSDAYEYDNPLEELNLDEWISRQSESYPLFKFWLIVMNLQVILLSFVRSIRQGDFELYKESLLSMIPWIFLFGHVHYARWLTIHLRDMEELPHTAPQIFEEFLKGKFVVKKSHRRFSKMGIDQAHEQQNALLKGKGGRGATGITHDQSKLCRWMVAGPQVVRLLLEFEDDEIKNCGDLAHHEQYPSFQRRFFDMVASLKDSFRNLEDPFSYKGSDLIVLHSRVVVDEKGVSALNSAEETGKMLFRDFVSDRLSEKTDDFFQKLRKNRIKIFTAKKIKHKSDTVNKNLKADNITFWRLYNASLARDLDLSLFFSHENQPYPPSLSENGNMRSQKKADLVSKLEGLVVKGLSPSNCDSIVLDGAFLVQALHPRSGTKGFDEYFSGHIKQYVQSLARKIQASRVDIVWDLYYPDSLKSAERESRGQGIRRKDLPSKGSLPQNWQDYLRNSENKKELFSYLGEKALREMGNLHIVTNINETVHSSGNGCTSMAERSIAGKEEADGRILLHVADMVEHGAERVLIRSTDTDVVVLAVSFFPQLRSGGVKELWVQYGTGKSMRYIAAHAIADVLGDTKSQALRGFHAWSGCDTVSFFNGKGKKTCWSIFMTSNEDEIDALCRLGIPSPSIPDNIFSKIEKLTEKLYTNKGKGSVNITRQNLFVSENRPTVLIPPTAAALQQHVLRAAYQAGQIWGRSISWEPSEEPSTWGWQKRNGKWIPLWSKLPDVWEACQFLHVCGCKGACDTQRCSCRAAGLACTPGCKNCNGNCLNKR